MTLKLFSQVAGAIGFVLYVPTTLHQITDD